MVRQSLAARGARTKVRAPDRGLALLQCFGDSQRQLGPTEPARLTGIPCPSATRLAATLVAQRWLRTEPDGGERFMLSAGVVSLAQVFLSGQDVRAALRGPMPALAERTGGSVYQAVRDGLALEQRLTRALAEAARTGCCLSAGEFNREINSDSVALTGPSGELMSFNCGGPAFVFTKGRLRSEVAPALASMVQDIAADIGGTSAAAFAPKVACQ